MQVRIFSIFVAFVLSGANALAQENEPKRWSIAIHGGAGTILPKNMTAEQEAVYRAALQSALDAGAKVLRDGGTAIEAVQAVIVPLEDDPKFNAGRGGVYNWDGKIEHDAAIMDGMDRSAGAITGTSTIRNPILLANAVRRDGRHVFLSGAGAEQFARENGQATVDPKWFGTERRRKSLERLKARELSAMDVDHKFGTVGAVALDTHGNLAAGTSTGGLTGKRWGRIGDAPIIGAGTYADNRSCAVSATGAGEYFIRVGVAQEICSRLRQEVEMSPAEVGKIAQDVLTEVEVLGGSGGVIVVTPEGHAESAFNTPGMYRGRASSQGVNEVAIFAAETAGSGGEAK